MNSQFPIPHPRRSMRILVLILVLLLAAIVALVFRSNAFRQRTAAPATSPTRAEAPRVVSLVPAASEIIEAIGAGDHLVAVSNYDVDPRTAKLPRVGDYLTTDWERIAPLAPNVIVTQYAEGRTPAGFAQRAVSLRATQLNLHIYRLDDVYLAAERLGEACGEREKGIRASANLKARMQAVRSSVQGQPPVRTLLVVGPDGSSIVGPNNYLDDLLTSAGGTNVAGDMSEPWPTIDHERLAALAPQVIIQLLANPAPQVEKQAEAVWKTMPDVPAVRQGRVVRLSEWYVMQPGYEVATLAERFVHILHPNLATQPATAPSTQPARP